MHFEEVDSSPSRAVTIMSRLLMLASIGLYVACLNYSAYTVVGKSEIHANPAFEILLVGWLGVFYQMFEWYANPLLMLSWLLAFFNKQVAGLLCAFGAMTLALSFLGRAKMVLDESPNYGAILSRDLGYWLWIAAIAVSLVALVIPMVAQFVRNRRQMESNRRVMP